MNRCVSSTRGVSRGGRGRDREYSSPSDRRHGVYHVYGVAGDASCPADSYDPALSRDCVSPPCDRWTPMRAVERGRVSLSLSPFPACGNSRRRPSVESPLVRCLPAPDRRMSHGNGPRGGEPRKSRRKQVSSQSSLGGMENTVYGELRLHASATPALAWGEFRAMFLSGAFSRIAANAREPRMRERRFPVRLSGMSDPRSQN